MTDTERRQPQAPPGYEPPRVETVITEDQIPRQVAYAGLTET